MSDDCNHNHTSCSEESYFYKETKRLVEELRRLTAASKALEEAMEARAAAEQKPDIAVAA